MNEKTPGIGWHKLPRCDGGRLNRSLKIDPEVMWEIATVHLPALDQTIRKMLADLG